MRNKAKWTNDLLIAASDEERTRALNKYRKPDIKSSLDKMCNSKCAYCESKIGHADYEHIEHYKPTSIYPGDAFNWENLLFACGICNGNQYKGGRFPDPAAGGPLLNPCVDDPTQHLRFEFDARTKIAVVIGMTLRGVTTEQHLGLNRPKLVTHRYTWVRNIAALKRLAITDVGANALYQEAIKSESQYAAFARSL
jgi:uncharacterized protein (TIGR02646 family)